MVVSDMQSGRYPAGFWETLRRAGMGGCREAEDCGDFKKVEWACVYFLELGTQQVGVVWGDMSL